MTPKPVGNIEALLAQISAQNQAPSNVHPLPGVEPEKPQSVPYSFENIPERLKAIPQWVCWSYIYKHDRKKWDKVPFHAPTRAHADSTGPETWCSFEDAVRFSSHYDGIGFVVTHSTGLVIIDLDDKLDNPATEEEHKVYQAIYNNFATYTELSPSGRGVHIVCEGNLGNDAEGKPVAGMRPSKGHIEVYAAKRYLAFTGNTDLSGLSFIPQGCATVTEVDNCQGELDQLIAYLGKQSTGSAIAIGDIDVPQTKTHQEVIDACAAQSNGATFVELYHGRWQHLGIGDGSQSGPDMSFMEFLRNAGATIQQTLDIFKASGLYRAPPLKHRSYPLRTARAAFRIGAIERAGAQAMQEQSQALLMARIAAPPAPPKHNSVKPLDWPPGTAGSLAQLFYEQSPLPNKQIAISAALGFLAGVCGLNWQTPTRAGLNSFLVLVAPSGMGKEAATDLPARLYRDSLPHAVGANIENPFFNGVLASAPALVKTLAHKRSMLKNHNEIGKLFRACNGPRVDGNAVALMDAFTRLYSKSGIGSTLGALSYSQSEKDVEDPGACALSILGDVTTAELFPNLNSDSATDGALSRMDFIQVHGERPVLNRNAGFGAPPEWRKWTGDIIMQAHQLRNAPTELEQFVITRYADAQVEAMLNGFEEKCRVAYNTHDEGFAKQSYTRGHLKALKYASMCAVADNHISPAITTQHAQWAIEFVENTIAMFEERVESGDVGQGDDARTKLVKTALSQYLPPNPAPLAVYGASAELHALGLVPLGYLSRKLTNYAAFKNHPLGPSASLRQTMENLEHCGVVHCLEKAELAGMKAPLKSRLYRVLIAL